MNNTDEEKSLNPDEVELTREDDVPDKDKNSSEMALTDANHEQISNISDRLAGNSIVISGVFARHSRDEYKSLIEQHGGKNVSSISKNTSFILAGENMGPSKLEKAKKLAIRIVNEDEFLSMIGE